MADKNKIDPNVLIKVGAVVAGYFIIVKPLLEFLNLKSSPEDKIVEEAAKLPAFNPNFYKEALKNPPKGVTIIKLLNQADTKLFAEKIGKALFSNPVEINEEAINDIFKRLTTQAQVSVLSDYYSKVFNSDLYADLKSKLTSKEFATNINKINKYFLYHSTSF